MSVVLTTFGLWILCLASLGLAYRSTFGVFPISFTFQICLSLIFAFETALIAALLVRARGAVKRVSTTSPSVAHIGYLVVVMGLIGWSVGIGSCAEAFEVARWADVGGETQVFHAFQDFVMAWIVMGTPVLLLSAIGIRRVPRKFDGIPPTGAQRTVGLSRKTVVSLALWLWQHGVIVATLGPSDLSVRVATLGTGLVGLPLLLQVGVEHDTLTKSSPSSRASRALFAAWAVGCAAMTALVIAV